MALSKITVSLVIILTCFTASLQAQTIVYVDPDAPGANNGTSWTDAYLDLRQALDGAAADTTLRVAEGSYSPGQEYEDTFQLKHRMHLEGGYAGYGAPDPDARDFSIYTSVLDGHERNYHVVNGSATYIGTTIDGFTITGGYAHGSEEYAGGGMYIQSGSPSISNCTFRENRAKYGGGLYSGTGQPKVIDCIFTGNAADIDAQITANQGGGVCSHNGNLTLINCTFSENTGGYGGGLYTSGGSDTLADCIFSDNEAESGGGIYNHDNNSLLVYCSLTGNSAENMGGGIYIYKSQSLLSYCTIDNNTALKGGGLYCSNYSDVALTDCEIQRNRAEEDGGGIFNKFNQVSLAHCLVQENVATNNGGGISNKYCKPILIDCSIIGNTAGGHGGGINSINNEDGSSLTQCTFRWNSAGYNGGGLKTNNFNLAVSRCVFSHNSATLIGGGMMVLGQAMVTNCLFHNNSASLQGGGSYIGPSAVIRNCTFFDNLAGETGGGIRVSSSTSAVSHCILWNNSPDQLSQFSSPLFMLNHTCIQDGYEGEEIFDADPLFVDPENNNYRLTRLSPCINRGTNDEALMEDLDGNPRTYMGTTDLGAYEYTGPHTLTANSFTLPLQGGTVIVTLQAEAAHAGHEYIVLGGKSGTAPGLPLPGGQATLPINTDPFTDIVLYSLNTALFYNFYNVLDGSGSSVAIINIPADTLPQSWLGRKLVFAYTIDSYDFVSNPVKIEVTSE